MPDRYDLIDIGANFGVWSYSLASHFSRVVAVEPDANTFRCLEWTQAKHGFNNIEIINVALSDRVDEGWLHTCLDNAGDSRIYDPGDGLRLAGTPVKLMTFDSLVEHHRLEAQRMFIKLDAQGSEFWIIQGMRQTLLRAQDVILFTELQQSMLNDAGSSVEECLSLLRELGFTPVDLLNGLADTDWQQVLDSRATTRDYCFRLTKVVS